MKKILLIIAIPFLFSCASTENYSNVLLSKNFSADKYKRVTVYPFIQKYASRASLDYSAADRFSFFLMQYGFTVVERTQIQKIIDEQKYDAMLGLSKADIKEIGNLNSVNAIVFGSLEFDGKHVLFENIRFVDVNTAEIVINATSEWVRGRTLEEEICIGIQKKLEQKKK